MSKEKIKNKLYSIWNFIGTVLFYIPFKIYDLLKKDDDWKNMNKNLDKQQKLAMLVMIIFAVLIAIVFYYL